MDSVWPESVCDSANSLDVFGTEQGCIGVDIVDNHGIDSNGGEEASILGGSGHILDNMALVEED